MKRFLKWFFGIFFFLVILLVGAIIALPYIVNPNDYKDEIIAQLEPHMRGRNLQIPGDIKLSIFPWLGVEVGKMVIGNAEGFVLKPFMTINNSKAHIRFLSLFSDKPEIGSLEFRDVNLYLQRDAEGRNNWSDLAQGNMSTLSGHGLIKVSNDATPKQQTRTTNNQTEFSLPSLKVEGLHFYNVRIELNDKLNKDQITISKLNLDAGPIDELNPVPLKGKFNFHSKKNELAAASAFASTLVMNAELNDLSFKQFIMNTNLTAKSINENVIKTSLRVPDLNIKTKEEKITAKPLHLKIDDMKGEGRLTVSRFTRPIIRFGLQTDKLNLDRLIPATTKHSAQQAEQKSKPAQQQADDIPTVEELIGEKPVLVEDTDTAFFAPLAAFKDTDMQGTISADQLTVRNLLMTNVRVVLQARSGLVSALPTATLYEGVYDGNLQIQTKAQPALLSTKHVLRDVQIGPIIKALYGKDSMTGRANIQGQFFSTGATREEIARNMNGDGQFSVRDAEIKTLDIKQLILKENYEKLKFVQEKEQDKEVTVFNTMRGTIRVKSGIAYNNDFTAISRRVHLKGKGNADLNQQTLKYTVTAIPKKSLAFDFGGRRIELKNKLIRTHFTGPWSNIDIDNDLEQVLKAEFKQTELYKKKRAQQEKIKEEVEQEKGKLEEKYKDKLDEILSR